MVGTRRPGRARTRKSMNNEFEMHTDTRKSQTDRNHIFLNHGGCILNEKMIPDVIILVPELEFVKHESKTNVPMYKCGVTRNFQILHP
jgi:hypothetical protein